MEGAAVPPGSQLGVAAAGIGQGLVGGHGDVGIDPGLERLDARQHRLHHLHCGGLAAAQQRPQFSGRQGPQLVWHR